VRSIQSTPAFNGANRYSKHFQKLDPHSQLEVLLDHLGSAHLHRDKPVASTTKKARAFICHQFIDDVKKAGFKIQNLLNVEQRHIHAACQAWREAKVAASTIQTRLSVLRWLSKALGKRGLVLDATEYGFTALDIRRRYVAMEDKSWSSKTDTEKLIDAANAKEKWTGLILELQLAFGLRLSEAMLLRPRSSDTSEGLIVEHGTKGAKTRVVPIRTPKQRDVLDRAKKASEKNAKGSMVPRGYTPAQARARMYYVLRVIGATKAGLGITSHGLRHQYANDRYEEITGIPTVTRETSKLLKLAENNRYNKFIASSTIQRPLDRPLDEAARHTITAELGHARLSITAAYTGPRPMGRPPASGLASAG
jgi:integrase